MIRFLYFIIFFILTIGTVVHADSTGAESAISANNKAKYTTIKSNMFSITLPNEFKGLYKVKKEKDKISVFHKESKQAGFGGFVFGIKAYKNPADHATLPGSTKIGELTDKKGNLYDKKP